ncbi:MAG: InlB B-repeat-containing protein, partial [Clostridia bacterium]|nr:InlB B-repeat-containing protein [Clostridia bacterium]
LRMYANKLSGTGWEISATASAGNYNNNEYAPLVLKYTGSATDKTTLQLTTTTFYSHGTETKLAPWGLFPALNNSHNGTKALSSSDTEVFTVDANGLVTAVAQGVAVITVTTVDGSKTATITIDVDNFAAAVQEKYGLINAMEENEAWSTEDKALFAGTKTDALTAILGCNTATALETTYRSYYNELSAIGKVSYTVTYVYIKADGTEERVPETLAEGSVLNGAASCTAAQREAYEIVGWYTLGEGDAHVPFTFGETAILNSDLTIYADYQIKRIVITFNADGGTFENGAETATQTVDYDSPVEPETPTKTGASFLYWYYLDAEGKEVKYDGTAGFTKATTLIAKWLPGGVQTIGFASPDKAVTDQLNATRTAGKYYDLYEVIDFVYDVDVSILSKTSPSKYDCVELKSRIGEIS